MKMKFAPRNGTLVWLRGVARSRQVAYGVEALLVAIYLAEGKRRLYVHLTFLTV